MSKAPETIYINALDADCIAQQHKIRHVAKYSNERLYESDIAYVHHSIAYGYASEVERLRSLLDECELELRHSRVFVRTRERMHECGVELYDDLLKRVQIETMARDALTKEG